MSHENSPTMVLPQLPTQKMEIPSITTENNDETERKEEAELSKISAELVDQILLSSSENGNQVEETVKVKVVAPCGTEQTPAEMEQEPSEMRHDPPPVMKEDDLIDVSELAQQEMDSESIQIYTQDDPDDAPSQPEVLLEDITTATQKSFDELHLDQQAQEPSSMVVELSESSEGDSPPIQEEQQQQDQGEQQSEQGEQQPEQGEQQAAEVPAQDTIISSEHKEEQEVKPEESPAVDRFHEEPLVRDEPGPLKESLLNPHTVEDVKEPEPEVVSAEIPEASKEQVDEPAVETPVVQPEIESAPEPASTAAVVPETVKPIETDVPTLAVTSPDATTVEVPLVREPTPPPPPATQEVKPEESPKSCCQQSPQSAAESKTSQPEQQSGEANGNKTTGLRRHYDAARKRCAII